MIDRKGIRRSPNNKINLILEITTLETARTAITISTTKTYISKTKPVPLSIKETEQIVDLQVAELQKRLAERGFTLMLTSAARSFVASAAYDPVYGARPLKRYLQHHLETRIGRAMIAAEVKENSCIKVDVENGQLSVNFETA